MLGVLFITILLSTSFISAGWWDDWFGPGPGLSPEDESVIEFQENVVATFRGNQGPWEHHSSKGGDAKPPTLALEGIFSGQVVTIAEDPTEIYSLRIYPKRCIVGLCTNDIETQCDVGTIGTFTNDKNEKIGDNIPLVDFKIGIPVPEEASKLYVSIIEPEDPRKDRDRKTKYFDNSGNRDTSKNKYKKPCSVTVSVGPDMSECKAYAEMITSFMKDKEGESISCGPKYRSELDANNDGAINGHDMVYIINLYNGYEKEKCESVIADKTNACIIKYNAFWDIDYDDRIFEETDGKLIAAYLAEYTGESLTKFASANAKRKSDEIPSYLECMESSGAFDVDGDGDRDMATDGILISRYLVGWSGDDLINGAVSTGATRTTSAEILKFLNLKGPEECIIDKCTDSDGGKDYYVKGYITTSVNPSEEWDYCFDGTDGKYIVEHHCDSPNGGSVQELCPNGCQDGACIPGKEPYCSAIGSKSEGWYQTVLDAPGALIINGDKPAFDQCDSCVAECIIPEGDPNTGDSMPIGWYSSCKDDLSGLIKVDASCSPECIEDSDCITIRDNSCSGDGSKSISTALYFQCSSHQRCVLRETSKRARDCNNWGCETGYCNSEPLCEDDSVEWGDIVQGTTTEINGVSINVLNLGADGSEIVTRVSTGYTDNLILTSSNPITQVETGDKIIGVGLDLTESSPRIKVTCGEVNDACSGKEINWFWTHSSSGKLSLGYQSKEVLDVNINLIKEKDDGSYEGSECDTVSSRCEEYEFTIMDEDGHVTEREAGVNCDLLTDCVFPDFSDNSRNFVKLADSSCTHINKVREITERRDACEDLDRAVLNKIAKLRETNYMPNEGASLHVGDYFATSGGGGQVWRVISAESKTMIVVRDMMDLTSDPVEVVITNGRGDLILRDSSIARVDLITHFENYFTISVNENPRGVINNYYCTAKVDIDLNAGWNMINYAVVSELFREGNEERLNSLGMDAAFLYDKSNKVYIRLHPFMETSKFNTWRSSLAEEDEGAVLHSSIWIYSPEQITLELKLDNIGKLDINDVKLKPYWSFISRTPQWAGKTFNHFKGDCDVQALVEYDSLEQEWDFFSVDEMENTEFKESQTWRGMLVKVSEQCQMGSKENLRPGVPVFPTFPEVSGNGGDGSGVIA